MSIALEIRIWCAQVAEVKKRKVLGILRNYRVATLKMFLKKISKDKVKEVCIDMKESLRKVAEEVFPRAKVVLDPFRVIANSNRRMDEAKGADPYLSHTSSDTFSC